MQYCTIMWSVLKCLPPPDFRHFYVEDQNTHLPTAINLVAVVQTPFSILTLQAYSPASFASIELNVTVLVYRVWEAASGGVEDTRLCPVGVVHTMSMVSDRSTAEMNSTEQASERFPPEMIGFSLSEFETRRTVGVGAISGRD